MHLSKFVHTKTGRILMSILLGFGLASLFKHVCKGDGCIQYLAPTDMKDDDIYKYDGTCYNAEKTASVCDAKKNTMYKTTK